MFLLDPAKADLMAKKRVAVVQSHEVAHMWYVSLVIEPGVCNLICMKVRQHYDYGLVGQSVSERRYVTFSLIWWYFV